MPISKVRPAHHTPGTAVTLDILAAMWVCAALLAWNGLREQDNTLTGATTGDNGTTVLAVALCMLGATIAFAAAAILHHLARRGPVDPAE